MNSCRGCGLSANQISDMLVAFSQGQRVEASAAQRGVRYFCPGCHAEVILKRGRKVCAHFAHKSSTTCVGSRGETRAHLAFKALITQTLRERGLRVEPEYTIGTVPWERRADVMVWAPVTNTPIAIELQRSSLSIRELEVRARSYSQMDIAQFWIAFLPSGVLEKAVQQDETTWRVSRHAPRQHELWIHGQNNHEGAWMADPKTGMFWHTQLKAHELITKEAIWYDMGVDKKYRKPSTRISKRYRDLHLNGPFYLEDLKIRLLDTLPAKTNYFQWPGGKIASFVRQQ